MAKNFRELEAKMPLEARARSDAKTQRMIEEMALNELRLIFEGLECEFSAVVLLRELVRVRGDFYEHCFSPNG